MRQQRRSCGASDIRKCYLPNFTVRKIEKERGSICYIEAVTYGESYQMEVVVYILPMRTTIKRDYERLDAFFE